MVFEILNLKDIEVVERIASLLNEEKPRKIIISPFGENRWKIQVEW